MSDDAMTGREREGRSEMDSEMDADEIARQIDALMAAPPKGLPSIVVFGDDVTVGRINTVGADFLAATPRLPPPPAAADARPRQTF